MSQITNSQTPLQTLYDYDFNENMIVAGYDSSVWMGMPGVMAAANALPRRSRKLLDEICKKGDLRMGDVLSMTATTTTATGTTMTVDGTATVGEQPP